MSFRIPVMRVAAVEHFFFSSGATLARAHLYLSGWKRSSSTRTFSLSLRLVGSSGRASWKMNSLTASRVSWLRAPRLPTSPPSAYSTWGRLSLYGHCTCATGARLLRTAKLSGRMGGCAPGGSACSGAWLYLLQIGPDLSGNQRYSAGAPDISTGICCRSTRCQQRRSAGLDSNVRSSAQQRPGSLSQRGCAQPSCTGNQGSI